MRRLDQPSPSQPAHPLSLKLARALGLGACGLLTACVFGYRGELDFSGQASLAQIDTIQLRLPATELTLRGDPGRGAIAWSGRWVTLGGSSEDALRGAREAALVWGSWESVGRLRAELPAAIRDLTALERLEVESAADLAHELVGAGDVLVTGVDAYLSVELEGGDVEVEGGLEQLVIRTERGDVSLETAADVDVYSGLGSVRVASEAGGELLIEASGPVVVELAETANLDIDIADAGPIVVTLDGVGHVGEDSYRRALGAGTRTLRVRSGGGRVELRPLELDQDPGETGDTGG